MDYRLYELDVWGNPEDGYDINDYFETDVFIDIPEVTTNRRILKIMFNEGIFSMDYFDKIDEIEVIWSETSFLFEFEGKPICEIRLEDRP